MRALFTRLFELRRSPERKIRVAWWFVTCVALLIILANENTRTVAFVLAILVNGPLYGFAAYWGVTRLRSLRRAWGLGARWGFWVAVLGTLTTSSMLGRIIADFSGVVFPVSLMLFTSVFVLFPLFFLTAFMLSCFGAALCAWAARKDPDVEKRTWAGLEGVPCVWLSTVLITAFSVYFGTRLPRTLTGTIIAFFPIATLACLSYVHRFDPEYVAQSILRFLGDKLIWKKRWRGRERVWDFRGAALGGVAALLVLGAVQLRFFSGLQSTSLAFLMQVSNATTLWTDRLFASEGVSSSGGLLQPTSAETLAARERIVLLQMDTPVQHSALTDRSEASVQAEIISKLQEYGAKGIILPLPLLPDRPDGEGSTFRNSPLFTPLDLKHSQRDIPLLAKAARTARNVILVEPQFFTRKSIEEDGLPPIPAALRAAVKQVCTDGLTGFGTAQLPTIPVNREQGFVPAPLAVFSTFKGEAETLLPEVEANGTVKISGMNVPLISPGRILVNFDSAEPGHDFTRLTYSDVLSGQALYAGKTRAGSDTLKSKKTANLWLSPRQFFQDKVIFLDTLSPVVRDTPVGAMTQNEAMAYASSMLLTQSFLGRTPFFWVAVVTLLIAIFVGQGCTGRSPLQASWRVGIALLTVVILATMTIVKDIWFDPVTPVLGVIGAFLLATQFTYGLERQGKERNRALLQRLVAPEFVEELLEDPEGKLGLHGKRQQVCILFADVRGFTPFAEANTPETVVEIINAYLTPMTQALLDKGGILDKYTGDGLMAIFRITRTPRENVILAVQAALEMQRQSALVSQRLIAEGKPPLPVGIGVHYGEAIVGLIGNPPHQMNYTALGIAVVVSQRLQSLAAGGEVIISESVYDTVGTGAKEDFHVEPSEPVSVKGLSLPVRPYRVTALPSPPIVPSLPAPAMK